MADYQKRLSNAIIKLAKRKGWPVRIYCPPETERSRQIEKDVNDYIMFIEEGHKKAANSKLRFGYCF